MIWVCGAGGEGGGGGDGGVAVGDPPDRKLFGFAENYRLQSAYEKHLIIKIVLVRGGGRGWGGVSVSPHPTLTPPPLPPPALYPTVSVCKFIPKSFLHRFLPQRHGAAEGGEGLRGGSEDPPVPPRVHTDGHPSASSARAPPRHPPPGSPHAAEGPSSH